jgi:hypothetical protein
VTADVRDRLRQLSEAHGQATAGPWVLDEDSDVVEIDDPTTFIVMGSVPADAAAIVAAHNNLPWLVAALTAAVFDLHTSDGAETPFCNECGHTYPCLTVRAVVAAAGGEGE